MEINEYVHPDLSSLLNPNDCTGSRIYTALGFVKKMDGEGKHVVAVVYDPRKTKGWPSLTAILQEDDGTWRFAMGVFSDDNMKALEDLVGEDLSDIR